MSNSNGWTPYLALGTALKDAGKPAPAFSWPNRDSHDAQTLRQFEELAAELGLIFASVERKPALALVDVREWISGWQEQSLAAAESLRNAADLLDSSVAGYVGRLGLKSRENWSGSDLRAMKKLATALQKSLGYDVRVACDRELPQCADALKDAAGFIGAYSEAQAALGASYGGSVLDDLDLEKLDRQWREAQASIWPASMLGKRKVQGLLQTYVEQGTADPERDVEHLRRMRECLDSIHTNMLATKPVPFSGLTTDVNALAKLWTAISKRLF